MIGTDRRTKPAQPILLLFFAFEFAKRHIRTAEWPSPVRVILPICLFGLPMVCSGFCRYDYKKFVAPLPGRGKLYSTSSVITMRHMLLPLVLFQLGLIFSPISQAEGYELCQGWHAGDYYLSGYTNIEAIDRFGTPAKLDLDDLSLFAGGHISQWVNPFMEAELSGHTLIQQGGGRENGDVVVERFYNDAMLSEHDTLRVGKILTPLGDWNLVHAAPLICSHFLDC